MVVCQSAACTRPIREAPTKIPIANARPQQTIVNYLLETERQQALIGSAGAKSFEVQKKARAVRVLFFKCGRRLRACSQAWQKPKVCAQARKTTKDCSQELWWLPDPACSRRK